MAQVVTADIKFARRIVVINSRMRYSEKSLAHRRNRRVERSRLLVMHDQYEPLLKPRLTSWDIC